VLLSIPLIANVSYLPLAYHLSSIFTDLLSEAGAQSSMLFRSRFPLCLGKFCQIVASMKQALADAIRISDVHRDCVLDVVEHAIE
jgi:hypothetical protein